jgi:hypothetical protein
MGSAVMNTQILAASKGRFSSAMYSSVVNVGKVVRVINLLSTTLRRCMGEWRYSSTTH